MERCADRTGVCGRAQSADVPLLRRPAEMPILLSTSTARVTCEPGTNTYYYDEDLDGNVDEVGQFPGCSYEDCVSCNIETSGDLTSSPSGTTNHGAGNGWCRSGLDDLVGCAASPSDCSEMCVEAYGDNLVAIDWVDDGDCYCQNDCQCMQDVGDDEVYLITRDSAVASLPQECGPGEGDEGENTISHSHSYSYSYAPASRRRRLTTELSASFGLRVGTAEGDLVIIADDTRASVSLGRTIDWRVFHHFCLTYDGPSRGGESTLAFYFDGDQQLQETLSLDTKIEEVAGCLSE